MRKNRLNYALIDPGTAGYSASRIASIFMVVVDALWAATAVLGLPPKEAFVPISSMLSACTVAAFSAYGLNSAATAWRHTGEAIASSVFSKTTVTSQVDSGPPADGKPPPVKPAPQEER